MKVTLLGAGTSSGVPRLGKGGPDWGQCDPSEPRNRRTRASLLVQTETTSILVDTSPDLREQLLAAGSPRVDAVVWTHEHADHTHGIDDLRQLFQAWGEPIRCTARPECWRRLVQRFHYAFQGNGPYPAILYGEPLNGPITIGDISIRFIDMPHGGIVSSGLLFEAGGSRVGYATDFAKFSPAMRSFYRDLDMFVVDALRRRPHPTHPTLAQTLDGVAAVRPKHAVLMHMDGSMDYRTLCEELPAGVEPGYDGLTWVSEPV